MGLRNKNTMGKTRTEASRAERKAKKRAAEDAIPDVPESWTAEPATKTSKSAEKDSKKRKRDGDEDDNVAKKERKKRRKETEASEAIVEGAPEEVKKAKKSMTGKKKDEATDVEKLDITGDMDTEMTEIPVVDAPKKSKKERKAERKAKEAAANGTATTKSGTNTDAVTESNGPANGGADNSGEKEEKKSKKNNRNREKKRKGANATQAINGDAPDDNASSKTARFIVFVGQLPFTATKESVEKHFASIKPKSVRVPTEKGQAGKAKGYAFVEFEGYDHMKTCLKLFHHSLFNDGI